MSNFFTPEFNNESAIAPWNASLEPIKAIIPQLDANRVLTGGVGQEVNIPTLTPEAYDNIILPDASLTRMASAVSTDSNTSLPDSSVDLLTGEAMSEVYGDLSKFAADPNFAAKLNVPFGENWDAAAAKTLAEAWFQGDFSDIPQVKIVSSAEIGGANGAFAAATDTIYLSRELLAGGDLGAIADVLREEIGHSVDVRLNVTDSLGDEGAIFGAIVQGKELTEGELQGLKGEDDTATVLLDGNQYLVEKQLSSFPIQGSIGSFYNRYPAIASQLGKATSAEFQFSPAKWRQYFQNGAIFHSAQGTYSVRGSLGNYYLYTLKGENSQLGLPTSEESQSPPGSGNWRQSFEKGTLEWLSNGKPRVTLTTTQVPANNWKAEYFNNNYLAGIPVFSRYESSNSLNYNWGSGGPGNGVNNDNFSARWTGSFDFQAGDYTFKQSVDDGMRVWVDGNLIHDTWSGRNAVDYNVVRNMTAGQHTVKVEYKELTGAALAKVSWEKVGNPANGGSASLVKFGSLSGNDRNLPGTVFPYTNPFANISNTTPERWLGDPGQRARYIQDPEMPVVANTQSRSADQIRQVINYFNVEDQQNLRYKPNGWDTFCNIFARDVMRALRAPLPHWINTRELDANGMNDWLNNSANGWKKVTPQDATKAASQGIPTVASWKNVGGIGHIAVVRPEAGPTPDNPQIAQAGAKNRIQTTVSVGFGQTKNVSYFAYG